MTRCHWLASFLLELTMAGCVTVSLTSTPIVGGGGAALAVEVGQWCYGRRWIGVLPAGVADCPNKESEQWLGTKLFPLDDPPVRPGTGRSCPHHHGRRAEPRATPADVQRRARAAGLDRYCVYEPIAPPEVPPRPPSRAGLVGLDPDYCGISPAVVAGSNLVDHNGLPLYQLLMTAVAAPPLGTEKAKVRLAILDTLPTGPGFAADPQTLCSRHGDTLFRLSEALACRDGTSCQVDASSRLALATSPSGKPLLCDGGAVGWISDIGAAIVAEILDWSRQGAEEHLVLNLSLGWNARFGGHEPESEMPAPVRAVYQALELARCSGALVFSAAGNATPGPNATTGPLLPAAWETREKSPRVYAVSGVSALGEPLPNARPGARARRAAFGGPAAVPYDPQLEAFSPAVTGSSVATAVASALAAAHWARHPLQSPAAVVDSIERNGDRLGWHADRDLDSHRRPSRWLGSTKVSHLALTPWSGATTNAVVVSTSTGIHTPPASSIADQPWGYPQPGADPCPPCMIDPPTKTQQSTVGLSIWIELDPKWDWDELCVKLDAVELQASTGRTTYRLDPAAACWSGGAYSLTIPVDPGPLDFALLHWLVFQKQGSYPPKLSGSALSTPLVAQ